MRYGFVPTVLLLTVAGAAGASAAPPEEPGPDHAKPDGARPEGRAAAEKRSKGWTEENDEGLARTGTAPRAAAEALFHQGLADMEAGQIAEGCARLAASVATVPEDAVKGALAECYTVLGKLGEAWEVWRDLSTSASTAWARDHAATAAAALDRRLARVTIDLGGAAPANLVVTLNGEQVSAVAAEHRIAPGALVVVAASPEIERWTQTFHARPGVATRVEIPVARIRGELRSRTRAQRISLSVLGAGAAGFMIGSVYGGLAYADWRGASASCGGTTDHCETAGYASAQRQLASARRAATISSWSIGIGLGTAAVGLIAYVYVSDPSRSESARTWRASPMMGSQALGIMFTRSVP